MNHERMLKVADVIEENPDHFNIQLYAVAPAFSAELRSPLGKLEIDDTDVLLRADLYDCDTTACIAGWACWLWAADADPDKCIDQNACEILGLSPDDAYDLFTEFDLDTAEKAAAHIRELVREDQER